MGELFFVVPLMSFSLGFFPQVRSASQRNTYKAPILDKGVTADATVGGAGRRLVVSLLQAGGS